jgi:hypothetical protein
MHMPSLLAGLLSADKLAAVSASRVDDLLASEVTMYQKCYLLRPIVAPVSTPSARKLSASSLWDPRCHR